MDEKWWKMSEKWAKMDGKWAKMDENGRKWGKKATFPIKKHPRNPKITHKNVPFGFFDAHLAFKTAGTIRWLS
jgi:hypothetical protein